MKNYFLSLWKVVSELLSLAFACKILWSQEMAVNTKVDSNENKSNNPDVLRQWGHSGVQVSEF